MQEITAVASSACANCNKSHRTCTLKRCSGCSLCYYCSSECHKAHWKVHKVECKQMQATRAAIREGFPLDQSHPFEKSISTFEAEEFTEASFVEFIKYTHSLYFVDLKTGRHRSELEGVTESGYLRLITLAVRALNEYPDSVNANHAAFEVFVSYGSRYSDPSKSQALFEANVLDHIVRSLETYLYITDYTFAETVWFILSKMCRTERTKHLEDLREVGVLDFAIETLKLHARQQPTCVQVITALASWLQHAHVRGVALPPHDTDALLLNIVLVMKRFPDDDTIQGKCCLSLHQLVMGLTSRGKDNLPVPSVVIGAFDLLVAAINRFPTTFNVALEGSLLLTKICREYISETTKPRNADACIALASCLSHHIGNSQICQAITGAMLWVICESSSSTTQFLYSGLGLSSLGAVLQTHMKVADIVSKTSGIVYLLTRDDRINQMTDSKEYLQFVQELEYVIRPVLVQILKLHLDCANEHIVQNVMKSLVSISLRIIREPPELTELVREAMRRYPAVKGIQEDGRQYLTAFGLAFVLW